MSDLGPSPTFAHGHAHTHGPGPAPRPQMPPDGRAYFDPQHVLPGTSLSPTKGEHPPGSAAVPPSRKRTRESISTDDKPAVKVKAGSPTPPKDSKDGLPSILVREKKQKACANCRRAKLKCIVEDGETDCVRCRARKERCVFYPRGHDEDWQQTLTGDVYAAIRHLTHLSTTVHHILDHLVLHGIVPPMDKPLERFDAPEREMALLQGWGAERNRELVGPEGRKRARKGKKDDDEDDDDGADSLPQPFDYGAGVDLQRRTSNDVPPTVMRPSDMQIPLNNGYDRVGTSPEVAMRSLVGPQPAPQGFGNAAANRVVVNSDTADMAAGFNYNLTPNGRNAQGGPATGETGAGTTTGTGVTPETAGISSISPVDHGSFPAMVMDSGATNSSQTQSTALVSPGAYPAGQGIFGLLNGAKANGGAQAASPPVPSFQTDSLGSADPRPNIVKRGLIANNDALSLVNYFHSVLSPWLFGYRLQFTKFPYIPQGPSVITPFILSVMCLVAAERVPNMHEHRPTLAREVTQLLVNSPADSFISTLDQPFGGGTGNKDDDGEEELDPELGIGPEEIVGACILATFMTEREQAATIASSAFKWARGWIKWTSLTVPLPPTLGEVCGLLPVKRDATREDMARVWLLCYIVDGTEALQRDNPAAPRRDPMAYCHVLVPDSPLPGDSYSPHDILLTFHARLITLLRDWYHRRSQSEAAIAGAGAGAQAAAHARLASSINASLAWWRADLESHTLDAKWMRHVDLFWEFARMLVNATSAKSLSANPRLRAASWAHGVEAAVGLLEKCSSWPSRDELANLPPCYLSMITLAGSVLVDAIKDQGVADCPFQSDDAVPLLKDVADMLGSGGLPHQHVSRTAGSTLHGYAEQLSRFV